MRTTRLHCALLALVLLGGAAVLVSQDKPDDEKAKAERYAKEWKKYIDEQNGNIYVSGEVVSSTGEPLDGVKVYIDQCIAAGWENKHVKTTETVNKTLKFELKGVQVVYLRFVRDGYHAEELEFLFGEGAKPDRIEDKSFYYDNVRVVLEKIGELARLDQYDLWLRARPDGTATVWDISGVRATRRKTAYKEVRTQDLPLPGTVYACLVPSPAVDEAPSPVEGKREQIPKGSVVRIGVSDGADGGFAFVPLEGRTPSRTLRDMKLAPEAGYRPSFDLTSDEVVSLRQDAEVCFYFKLNGFYGKGRLSSVEYLDERGLGVRISFRLQPNGTGNVETTEWR
jgi:hypothetical protein